MKLYKLTEDQIAVIEAALYEYKEVLENLLPDLPGRSEVLEVLQSIEFDPIVLPGK